MNKSEWQQIFDAQKKSQLSIAEYCKQNKINDSAFYNAKNRYLSTDCEQSQPMFNKMKVCKETVDINVSGIHIQLTMKQLATLIKEIV